ncbi:MAG: hypothetical protein ACFFDW_12150, partial [Candidatus Thorarchaeota archaeon]
MKPILNQSFSPRTDFEVMDCFNCKKRRFFIWKYSFLGVIGRMKSRNFSRILCILFVGIIILTSLKINESLGIITPKPN